MHTLTDEELKSAPLALLDHAHRDQATLVTVDGLAVMMAVPLDNGQPSPSALVDLAATLFDSEQISLGRAARIAGLSHSEMIDELGRRNIDVARYSVDELKRELAYVSTIAGR
jgi:predicted HTH domain antitoxin